MRLSKVIASNKELTFIGDDAEISNITADSRNVTSGTLFVAIPGTQTDGRTYIQEAVHKGAVAIMAPPATLVPHGVSLITAADMRQAISAVASAYYPRQPDTVVAVTGTSGKTSTAQFTREIWSHMGYESASIGTLGLITSHESQYGSLTTPDAITLHRLLDECTEKGIDHLAMEASSHGIVMHRLDHVKLKAGGFTNFSRDHLDYHETMEKYFAAKMRLFTDILPSRSTAVLNADIPEFPALLEVVKTRGQAVIGFGTQAKELRLLESSPNSYGQTLQTEIFGKHYEISLPLIGSFQAFNALCALGLVIGSGGDLEQAVASLEKVSGVPGRLQLSGISQQGGAVFIDYAHKPDALENVLKALRPHVIAHPGARLGVIFGCGGNRDKGKRPLMGSIAQTFADWVIVTDDNPRLEDPHEIRKEILTGFSSQGPAPIEIGDRALAIETGISQLKKHDVLIIAGKGHEPGQIVGTTTLPFDDNDVAKKVLCQ